MIAADGNHGGVNDRAFLEDDQAGRSGAQVHQADAELALIGAQHSIGAGQRLEDGVVHVHACAVHRGDHVLRGARTGGNHVDADFEAHGHHAQRIMHAALLVENEFLRQQVENFAVGGQAEWRGLCRRQDEFRRAQFRARACPRLRPPWLFMPRT